jgi:hypothetical protein
MQPYAYVNHVPVLTGGVGRAKLQECYSNYFIPQLPPDTDFVPVSRTIGPDRLVEEMIVRFTHTIKMDWMLPGVAPTGKRVQLGLLDPSTLPVAGVETARKLVDPTPSHTFSNASPRASGDRRPERGLSREAALGGVGRPRRALSRSVPPARSVASLQPAL